MPRIRRVALALAMELAAMPAAVGGSAQQATLDQKLLSAVRENSLDDVRALLQQGANIEAKDKDGVTPLIQAVYAGRLEIVKLLLENHANMEAQSNNGDMPLLISALPPTKIEIVKVLLEHHANIEAQDRDGRSPLVRAAMSGTTDVVAVLIENHAKIEAKDNEGLTALMAAAYNGNVDIIKLLIAGRANKSATDKAGMTALGWAADWGRCNAVMVLAPDSQADLADCFKHALREYRKYPENTNYREQMLPQIPTAALAMKPPPTIPEEARRFFVQANASFKQAQNKDDYAQAASLYQQAVDAAPWWGDAWFNLSKAQEKLEKYQDAIHSLKTFLQCNPQDPEVRTAQDHVYELEMSSDKQAKAAAAAKEAADKRTQLVQQAQANVAFLKSKFAGYTLQGQQLCGKTQTQDGQAACTDADALGRNWHDFSRISPLMGHSVEVTLTGSEVDTIGIGFSGYPPLWCIKAADYAPGVSRNVWHSCGDRPNPIFVLNLDSGWGTDKAIYEDYCTGVLDAATNSWKRENCTVRYRVYHILRK